MYQNTHPLKKEQDIKYTQINTYTFAARENFCPVFLQELPQIVEKTLPMIRRLGGVV